MHKRKQSALSERSTIQRISLVQAVFVAAYALSIVIFDSWNLITHEAVVQRWEVSGGLLLLAMIAWFVAKHQKVPLLYVRAALVAIILANIVFAATHVYWERGMSSNATLLFAVPLLMSAALRSKGSILLTGIACAVAYSTSIVSYFFDNYGEGYRVQLWGTVALFSAVFMICSWLLIVITHPKKI